MPGEHIGSAQHEFRAYLWYLGDLTPYWTISGAVQGDEQEFPLQFEFDLPMPNGETEQWEYTVTYQKGSLAPRPDMGLDEGAVMREWRLKGRGPGQKKASFHLKPRWEDQRLQSGDLFKSPWMHLWDGQAPGRKEGVEATADGSNVPVEWYPHILDEVAKRIAVAGGNYWSRPFFGPQNVHRDSPITTCERYYRVEKGISQKLIRQDGYFGNLARLLTGEEGTRFIWDGDNTECLGYLHTFRYHAETAREYLPGEQYGKQLKHYYPKYVRGGGDDPLAHPKVGALFKQGTADGEGSMKLNKQSVRWGDRDALLRELEETLINTLENAEIPTDAPTSFVADDHFSVETTEHRIELHPDPTPAIEQSREASAAAAFRVMTDSMQDMVEVMADGGQEEYHVEELAEETGWSVSTVYRGLENLRGVLENENGVVRWACRKAAEEIRERLEILHNYVGSTVEQVGRLLGVDDRAFSKTSGQLQKVAAKYDIEFDETQDGRLRIDVGAQVVDLGIITPVREEVVRELYTAWVAVGRDVQAFREASIYFVDGREWKASRLIRKYRAQDRTKSPPPESEEKPDVLKEGESLLDKARALGCRPADLLEDADSVPPA